MNFYPFQEKLIEFFNDKDRGILAADAGLGKTAVILKILENKKLLEIPSKQVLVIVPASLRLNFAREIKIWGYPSEKFLIVSYEWIVKKYKEQDYGWLRGISAVVLDESQDHLRNIESIRTRAVGKISAWSKHIYFLTGTPVKKSSLDIWPTLFICEGKEKWGSYSIFANKYANKVYNPYKRGFEYTGFRNSAELKEKVQSCMVRCKKKDVLADLPPLSEHELYLEKEKLEIETVLSETDILKAKDLEHISLIRQITAFAKIPGYVESLEKRGVGRGIVFVWHKTVGEELSKKLGCPFLSGDVIADKRLDMITDFQSEKLNWLVCSIAACGVGFNLQNCKYVGFLEMPFTYAEIEQAYSRVWRIGNRGCYVEYILMDATIDIPIHRIVMRRKTETRELVG